MLNERGMALPLTLLVVMALASLGVGLLAVGAMEPQISRNTSDTTRARFAAESGIEWAYNTLVGTADWSTLLAGAPDMNGIAMTTNSAIPGLAVDRGTFSVIVRNDARPAGGGYPADSTYTGAGLDGGGANVDTNGRVILTSTGNITAGGQLPAVRTLQVVVERPTIPQPPGALNFPGNEAQTSFSGNSFEVDGRDWTYDTTNDTATLTNGCPAKWGISVSDTANGGGNEGVVESSLTAQQKDNVWGTNETDPTQTTWGNNAINTDPTLTQQNIGAFIAQAKKVADISLTSTQANPASAASIGDTCATNVNSSNCWGTKDYPKIVYVKGDPDPSSMFTALQISGDSKGYGILIVEDGDLKISGNFNWNGIIIVSGQWVGVGFLGGGFQSVYGAVISNETATDPGFYEGVLVGNAKVRYSCTAINTVRNSRRLVKMNWQEL
jgi:hypothetical protein